MPKRAPHPCSKPGCPGLALSGQQYCAHHINQERRQYDRERGSSAQRGYDGRWRRLRQMVLAEQPVCPDPFDLHPDQLVPATDVDHIVPKSRGGDDSLTNLRALCHRCHSHKTAKEDGRWEPGRVGA